MKKNKDISAELLPIAPLLEKMKQHIREPQAPAGFFEQFREKVISDISAIDKQEILSETGRISPLLAELKKEVHSPVAPEGYFAELQSNVFHSPELTTHSAMHGGISTTTSRTKLIRLFVTLSAAAAILLAVATTLRFLSQPEPISPVAATMKSQDKIVPAEIRTYQDQAIPASPPVLAGQQPVTRKTTPATPSFKDDQWQEDILAYLADNPADLEEESIAEDLGFTAYFSYSSTEIEDINNYLYENVEHIDETLLIKTIL